MRCQVFVFLHIAMCIVALVGLYLHIHLLHHHKVSSPSHGLVPELRSPSTARHICQSDNRERRILGV